MHVASVQRITLAVQMAGTMAHKVSGNVFCMMSSNPAPLITRPARPRASKREMG
jgi:hypothetical protein